MLPPTHKRFWAAFEEIRQAEKAAGKAWCYEADPFAVKREHDAVRERMEKRREAEAEAREGKKHAHSKLVVATGKMKGWQNVPVVDMGRERRSQVEALVRKYHVWNPQGVEMGAAERERVVRDLEKNLGFRRIHALEACEWTKDYGEALEWLLIHVPEDDVPPGFLPENYSVGITMSSGESLVVEYAAKRLAAAGYSLDLCHEALRTNDLSEDRAAEALMQMLVTGQQVSPRGTVEADLITLEDPEDDLWDQEKESLDAIYGAERFLVVSPNVFRITLNLQDPSTKSFPNIILEVRKPTKYPDSVPYPFTIPTFAIFTEGDRKIPTHVRLSIVRQTADYADTLKGDQLIFTVVMWLEDEILKIMENPGPLRDVATAITGSDERRDLPAAEQRKRKFRNKKGPIDWTPGTRESLSMLHATEVRLQTPEQKKMLAARMRLPAWQLRDEIVDAVNQAQVVIIR